jgi:hypothetical protein
MFSRQAARRTAAALTAALVAVLLVTFGGPTRAHSQRLTVSGTSQAAAAAKATRVQHAVPLVHDHQTPLHLDLATTPPGAAPDVRTTAAVVSADAPVVRTGSDLVTPTGRAPPAL